MLKISLAAARKNALMTQEDVASKMGVSKSTIINWEKGRVSPGVPELVMMSQLYDIPIDNIFLPNESTKSRATNNLKKRDDVNDCEVQSR